MSGFYLLQDDYGLIDILYIYIYIYVCVCSFIFIQLSILNYPGSTPWASDDQILIYNKNIQKQV